MDLNKMTKGMMERLKGGEVLVCDGAMGTLLQSRGLDMGECPDEWNITHEKDVQQAHFSYLESGCNIILTNTFGGNRLKLTSCGKEKWMNSIHQKALNNAKTAVRAFEEARKILKKEIPPLYILCDIGPTGQIMESSGGKLKFENAEEVFQEQIVALFREILPDEMPQYGLIFETFEDIEEIRAGITAAKNVRAKKGISFPIIASMTFHPGARGFRTMMGTSVQDAVVVLAEAGADIIGTNCGNGPQEIVQIIKEMRRYTDLPLIAQPNAGLPVLKEGRTVFPMGPDEFAMFGPQLREAGAGIIGGCCGTTPEHIKKMVDVLKEE